MERALAEANEPEAYVRIVVTRGIGELGLDPSLAKNPSRVIIVHALKSQPRTLYTEGVSVVTITVPTRAGDPTQTFAAKTSNYLANILALRVAKQAGAHEAFLVTADGTVLEGTTSNVFLVAAGALVTPSLDAAILAGITREHVIDAAREIGIVVRDQHVSTADLWTADEVFLTSSLRELVPVVQIDDHEVGAATPGAITRRIHRAFRARTPLRSDPMPWE
jgi:branched-chain amino acid aminotransferase